MKEIPHDSSLLMSRNQAGFPQISPAKKRNLLNKSQVINKSQRDGNKFIGSLPKSFNFVKKNKIRLLLDYIGQEEAKRNGIGSNPSCLNNMEGLVANRMEKDIENYENKIK